MGEDPDRIRRDIEQTRAQMDETVGALGHKADVKSRTKERVVGAGQSVRDKVMGPVQSASDAAPDREQVAGQARRAKGLAQDNPLGFAIGAAAVGFVAGLLIPSTRVEDEKLGPMSDQVTEKAKQTGQEALEHGKEVARETAEQAQSTLKESAQRHGEEVGETAKQHAEEVRS
jgi:gas vesicle protein